MKDAMFMMPTPRVLANVVDQLDGIDMSDRERLRSLPRLAERRGQAGPRPLSL